MESEKAIQQNAITAFKCDDVNLVRNVLENTTFYLSEERHPHQLIKITIPVENGTTDYLKLIVDPTEQQIVIDNYRRGRTQYSGIYATDMKEPMCPVFKH